MNRIQLVTVVFACLFMASQVQAQEPKSTDNIDRFSYSYGILLGDNLKRMGLKMDNMSIADLVKGMEASLSGQNILIDAQTAQSEVNNKLQSMQQAMANVQLEKNKAYFAENMKKEGMQVTETGIQYEVLVKGEGTVKPTAENKVKTHYHGTLIDGTVFDSSVERGQPIDFPVTGVIQGWQEVLKMMVVGDKWRVHIPSHLAYGNRPTGKIPANSILIFEMELLEIN